MKKIYQIIMLCAMSIAIASCGNSTHSGNAGNDENESKVDYKGDYRTAVQNGDFEEAHKILETISDFDKYIEAMKYIYINEIQTISLNDEDAEDKIVYLLSGIPTHGVRPNEGLIDFCYDFGEEMIYLKFVQTYNELCNTALILALNRKNKEFAQNVIGLYKEDLKILNMVRVNDISVDSAHSYALFSKKSINDAKKKYNDAIDTGLFGDETQKYKIEEDPQVKIK